MSFEDTFACLGLWHINLCRLFCVISRTPVEGVLPLCRVAVGIFYSPIRLGKRYFRKLVFEELRECISAGPSKFNSNRSV